jgi:alcohol dehydrogenase
MLGAAHGLANPLTAEFRTTHGEALAILLPQVIRFNRDEAGEGYRELSAAAGWSAGDAAGKLVAWVEGLRRRAGMPDRLQDLGIERSELGRLATEAAEEWTTGNNPRRATSDALATLYERAW